MLLHTVTIVATEEISLTQQIIFNKAQFIISAAKERNTPAISFVCL